MREKYRVESLEGKVIGMTFDHNKNELILAGNNSNIDMINFIINNVFSVKVFKESAISSNKTRKLCFLNVAQWDEGIRLINHDSLFILIQVTSFNRLTR